MTSSYIYCIYDLVENLYSPVFEARNDRTAVRYIRSTLPKSVEFSHYIAENQLLCISKLEKTNNDEFSELKVFHVREEDRIVDWPLDGQDEVLLGSGQKTLEGENDG